MIAARLDMLQREAELADPLADREAGELRQAEGEDRRGQGRDQQGEGGPTQQPPRSAGLEAEAFEHALLPRLAAGRGGATAAGFRPRRRTAASAPDRPRAHNA